MKFSFFYPARFLENLKFLPNASFCHLKEYFSLSKKFTIFYRIIWKFENLENEKMTFEFSSLVFQFMKALGVEKEKSFTPWENYKMGILIHRFFRNLFREKLITNRDFRTCQLEKTVLSWNLKNRANQQNLIWKYLQFFYFHFSWFSILLYQEETRESSRFWAKQ